MGRLIDADVLKREVNKKRVIGRFNTIKLIDEAPTAETITYADVKKAVDTAYKWGKIDGAKMRGEVKMTNQEAIEILNRIMTIGEEVDAIELAIKALETIDKENANV